MAAQNKKQLKTTVDNNIFENFNKEITGPILNSVLKALINNLVARMKVATISALSTIPSDVREVGMPVYVEENESIYILQNNKSTWKKQPFQDVIDTVSSNLSSHTGNNSNPHSVTQAQVGLENVTNHTQVRVSEVNQPDGVAGLNSDGKVPYNRLDLLKAKIIRDETDMPDLVDGKHQISGNYLIQGEVSFSNPVILTGDASLNGLDPRHDQLTYTGANTFIETNENSFNSFNLSFLAPSGTLFNATGAATKHILMAYCGFYNVANIGTFTTFNFCKFGSCLLNGFGNTATGFQFEGVIDKVSFSDMPFNGLAAGIAEININASFNGALEVKNNWFQQDNTPYIKVHENATLTREVIISQNIFENTESPFDGFNSLDDKYFVSGNPGVEDSKAILDAFFQGEGEAIEMGTEGYTDIALSHTVNVQSRLEYDNTESTIENTNTRIVRVVVSMALVSAADANNQDVRYALFLDTGTGFSIITGTEFEYSYKTAGDDEFIIVKKYVVLAPGDKIKLRGQGVGSTANITFKSSNIVIA